MKRNQYITGLTPMRGILASLVVFVHVHMGMGPLTTPDNRAITKLYLLVDMFFLLSGFILLYVYGDWFKKGVPRRSFFKFMKSRFARIYPLHFFILLYLIGWMVFFHSQRDITTVIPYFQNIFDTSAIVSNLTLTQAWGMHLEGTWNVVAWSISVEWLLYMLFPFLAVLFFKYKTITLSVLGILSVAGLFFIMYVAEPAYINGINASRGMTEMQENVMLYRAPNSLDIITGFALLRGFCSFVFGMIAYEFYQNGWLKKVLHHWFWFPVMWIFLIVTWQFYILPDPAAIIILGLMILHLAYAEGWIIKLLHHKIFNFLGKISYSIYMIHLPLLFTPFIINMALTGEVIPQEDNIALNWLAAIGFYLVVIGVATLTYRYIEKPWHKRIMKWKLPKRSAQGKGSLDQPS